MSPALLSSVIYPAGVGEAGCSGIRHKLAQHERWGEQEAWVYGFSGRGLWNMCRRHVLFPDS